MLLIEHFILLYANADATYFHTHNAVVEFIIRLTFLQPPPLLLLLSLPLPLYLEQAAQPYEHLIMWQKVSLNFQMRSRVRTRTHQIQFSNQKHTLRLNFA